VLARLVILLLLTSCASGFVVRVDSDESFSATKYKNFQIYKPDPFRVESDEEENPIRINRVAQALTSSLAELGLQQSDKSPLKISFAVKEKERFKQINSSHFFYGFRNDPFSYRFYANDHPPINYLSVKFFDQELDKVVWYANMRINITSLDTQELADEIVAQILSRYPKSS
jgi:hypothetical protein|tara:strand:- start:2456 stop:2971 length:516 start_codon:yes stop_codon:yes gene_type:complete